MTYNWSRNPGDPATEPKMVVFQSVPSWNWTIAAGSFIDEFTVEARELRNTLIGLCLGGALLMTGVLYWIARRQLAPVRIQLEVMQRIGAGDMTVRFPDCDKSSRNELDQMSLALQNTTTQVGALIREVMNASTAVRDAAQAVRLGTSEVFDGTATQSEAAAGLVRPRCHALLALASLARDDDDPAAAAHPFEQRVQARRNRETIRGQFDGRLEQKGAKSPRQGARHSRRHGQCPTVSVAANHDTTAYASAPSPGRSKSETDSVASVVERPFELMDGLTPDDLASGLGFAMGSTAISNP